jgi:hypothetical protein
MVFFRYIIVKTLYTDDIKDEDDDDNKLSFINVLA